MFVSKLPVSKNDVPNANASCCAKKAVIVFFSICEIALYFPNYLQQLEMESNGKSKSQWRKITYATAPVVFGQCGTDFQHSFTQLLCQGTEVVPCDFIAFAKSNYTNSHIEKKTTLERHTRLVSHFFAQQLALAFGTSFFETGNLERKQLCRI